MIRKTLLRFIGIIVLVVVGWYCPAVGAQNNQSVVLVPAVSACEPYWWPKAEKAVRDELQVLFDDVQLRTHLSDSCLEVNVENVLYLNKGVSIVYVGKLDSQSSPAIHLWLQKNDERNYYRWQVAPWNDAGALSFGVLNMSERILAMRRFDSTTKAAPTPHEPAPVQPPLAAPVSETAANHQLLFLGAGGGGHRYPKVRQVRRSIRRHDMAPSKIFVIFV